MDPHYNSAYPPNYTAVMEPRTPIPSVLGEAKQAERHDPAEDVGKRLDTLVDWFSNLNTSLEVRLSPILWAEEPIADRGTIQASVMKPLPPHFLALRERIAKLEACANSLERILSRVSFPTQPR